MKPTSATLIAALRSGLSTQAELAEYHGVEVAEILKPMRNLVHREFATRHVEAGVVEYKLTEHGRAWKPETRGQALRDAMRRGRAAA